MGKKEYLQAKQSLSEIFTGSVSTGFMAVVPTFPNFCSSIASTNVTIEKHQTSIKKKIEEKIPPSPAVISKFHKTEFHKYFPSPGGKDEKKFPLSNSTPKTHKKPDRL